MGADRERRSLVTQLAAVPVIQAEVLQCYDGRLPQEVSRQRRDPSQLPETLERMLSSTKSAIQGSNQSVQRSVEFCQRALTGHLPEAPLGFEHSGRAPSEDHRPPMAAREPDTFPARSPKGSGCES
jgi:hypothetical protein